MRRLIQQKRYKLKGKDITIDNNDYVRCPGRPEPGLFMGRNEDGTMKVRFVGTSADENVPWDSCSKVSSGDRDEIIELEEEEIVAVAPSVNTEMTNRFDLIKSFYAPNIGGIIPYGTTGTGPRSIPIANIATTIGGAVFTLTCSPDPRISLDIKNAFNDAINQMIIKKTDNVSLASQLAKEFPMGCYNVRQYMNNENEQEVNRFVNERVIFFEAIAPVELYVAKKRSEISPIIAPYTSIKEATDKLLNTHSPPVPEIYLLTGEIQNLQIALGIAPEIAPEIRETPHEIIRIRAAIIANNQKQLIAKIKQLLTAELTEANGQLAHIQQKNNFTIRELLDYNDSISRALTIYNDTTRAALDTLQDALSDPELANTYNRIINHISTAAVAMRESIKTEKAYVNGLYKYMVIDDIYQGLPIILQGLCEYIYVLEKSINTTPDIPLNNINMNKAILILPARNNVENYIMTDHIIYDSGINMCIYHVDNFISLRAQLDIFIKSLGPNEKPLGPNEKTLQEAAIAGALESAPVEQLNILINNIPSATQFFKDLIIELRPMHKILNQSHTIEEETIARLDLANALSYILLEIPIIQIAPALITTIAQAQAPQIAAVAAAILVVITTALAIPLAGVKALTTDQIDALNAAVAREILTPAQAKEISSALISALIGAAGLPPIMTGGIAAPAPAKEALALALAEALAEAPSPQLVSLSASVIAARIILLTPDELQTIIGALPPVAQVPVPLPESIIRIKDPRPIIDPITGESIPRAVSLTQFGKRKLISLIVLCQPTIRRTLNALLEADLKNAKQQRLTQEAILPEFSNFIYAETGTGTRAEIFENMYNGFDLYTFIGKDKQSAVIKLSKQIIKIRIFEWLTNDDNFQLPRSFILNEHGSNYEEQLGRDEAVCISISGYSSEFNVTDIALNKETQNFNEAFGKPTDNLTIDNIKKNSDDVKNYLKISGPSVIRDDLAKRRELLVNTNQKLSLTPKLNKLLKLEEAEGEDAKNMLPEVKAALVESNKGGTLKRSKIKHNNNKSRRLRKKSKRE